MRLLAPAAAVLGYALLVGWLHPQALSFDALAFLLAARAGAIDYGHALYLPLVRTAQRLGGGGLAPERAAQLVSALGAAVALALLWRALERRGACRSHAGLVAGCFALTTLFWQEAGSVEPTSWTIAAVLAAGDASERYARRPTVARLALAFAALCAAVGFHLVSLCSVPWLVHRARRVGGELHGRHAWVLMLGILFVAGLAAVGGSTGSYLRYWSGFLPDLDWPWSGQMAEHLARGGRLLLEGAPILLGTALLFIVLGRSRLDDREWLWLSGPYLLAFIVLGKPLVGLLAPASLGVALLLGAPWIRSSGSEPGAPARPERWNLRVLVAAAVLSLLATLPQAWRWRHEPDDALLRALLIARHVPAGARLLAGPLANHFRYYLPEIEVVSLPELWHAAHAEERSVDPIEVVRRALRAAAKPCVLSSDGAGFLVGPLGADVSRLGLSLSAALIVPEDPRLALFPLETRQGE